MLLVMVISDVCCHRQAFNGGRTWNNIMHKWAVKKKEQQHDLRYLDIGHEEILIAISRDLITRSPTVSFSEVICSKIIDSYVALLILSMISSVLDEVAAYVARYMQTDDNLCIWADDHKLCFL